MGCGRHHVHAAQWHAALQGRNRQLGAPGGKTRCWFSRAIVRLTVLVVTRWLALPASKAAVCRFCSIAWRPNAVSVSQACVLCPATATILLLCLRVYPAVLHQVRVARFTMEGPRWEKVSPAAKVGVMAGAWSRPRSIELVAREYARVTFFGFAVFRCVLLCVHLRWETEYAGFAICGACRPPQDFVSKLLVKKPEKRLTAEQALQHPWLATVEHDVSTQKLDPTVLASLRRFSSHSSLKVWCLGVCVVVCVSVRLLALAWFPRLGFVFGTCCTAPSPRSAAFVLAALCGYRHLCFVPQRVALETIAFSMSAAQIKKMREAFITMDKVWKGPPPSPPERARQLLCADSRLRFPTGIRLEGDGSPLVWCDVRALLPQDRTGFVNTSEFVEVLAHEGVPVDEATEIFRHADRDKVMFCVVFLCSGAALGLSCTSPPHPLRTAPPTRRFFFAVAAFVDCTFRLLARSAPDPRCRRSG